jgi:DNA polymerase-1
MTSLALFDYLAGRGITLAVNHANGKLRVGPASRLTDDDRTAIRGHKEALVALLAAKDNGHASGPSAGAQMDAVAQEGRTTTLPPCTAAAAGEDVVAVRLDDTCPAETTRTPASSPSYLVVDRTDLLPAVLAALEQTDVVAFDFETTGLDPRRDRPRLLSLGCDTIDGNTHAYILDLFALNPAPVLEALAGKELVAHNAAFDLSFLVRLGFTPTAPVHCTQNASRVLYAGQPAGHKLKDCARRELGIDLPKEMQKSDWSGTLRPEQLEYAARDVLFLGRLRDALGEKIAGADLEATLRIEERCLPAWVWMANAGMPLDAAAWKPLADEARASRAERRAALDLAAPERPGRLPGLAGWKWDSNKDVAEVLTLLGFEVENTKDETLAKIDHPFAEKLRDYRFAKWLDTTYGHAFLRHLQGDGRVYASWNQTGNVAGRSSSNAPNLQGVPRDKRYRRCFVAPPGRMIVKADFAAAHLRIAAKIADEQVMIAAFQKGKDLHRLTAASLLGKPESKVTGNDRQLAKAVAFGLLYAMGARGLQGYAKQNYGLEMTLAEAGRHKRKFFATYPGLARWHRRTQDARERQTETRSLAGRRRLLDPKTPLMHRLNSPVLGTEGDAAKTALALLWERRAECPGAVPIAFVHDEIVVEVDEALASRAEAWVKAAMVDALAPLIDPVPVDVEVRVAPTWGG